MEKGEEAGEFICRRSDSPPLLKSRQSKPLWCNGGKGRDHAPDRPSVAVSDKLLESRLPTILSTARGTLRNSYGVSFGAPTTAALHRDPQNLNQPHLCGRVRIWQGWFRSNRSQAM